MQSQGEDDLGKDSAGLPVPREHYAKALAGQFHNQIYGTFFWHVLPKVGRSVTGFFVQIGGYAWWTTRVRRLLPELLLERHSSNSRRCSQEESLQRSQDPPPTPPHSRKRATMQ